MPAAVSFAGPGKRDHELAAAIDAGVTINLESEAEADRALRLAEAAGKRPALGVRVNPDFAITGAGCAWPAARGPSGSTPIVSRRWSAG